MQHKTDAFTLEPLVAKLAYRAALTASEQAAIMSLPFALRNMERGQYIVRERELATHSCVMLSGFSIRSKVVAAGG